jgi:hypothetical protein
MAFDMDFAVSDHAVSDRAALLDRLDDALRAASELNLGLLSKIVAGACTRIPSRRSTEAPDYTSGRSRRMDRCGIRPDRP